jgi:hypothetical protein
MNFPHCEHLEGNLCGIASLLADQPIESTPETCAGCLRTDHPRDINEVTRALAGIELTDEGVGSTLHSLITWFIPVPAGCNCPDRVAVMNAWGPKKCEENKSMILNWLRESAFDHGYRYSEFLVSSVLDSVIMWHRIKNK